MSVNRSRIGRSSSLGETCMVDLLKPSDSPTPPWRKRREGRRSLNVSECPFVAAEPDKPRRSTILTLGSPIRETTSDGDDSGGTGSVDERIGRFLEACHFCKKKIGDRDEIFMYSYLRAFCSPECRDKQIALNEKERSSSRSH